MWAASGENVVNVLPLRPLLLQCGTWYRPSSTACGRSPFPVGEGFLELSWGVSVKQAPKSPVQKLPLRGSWQGAALTDEAAGQPETFQKQ